MAFMDFILRVCMNIIFNELRQQRVKYDVHTTSKLKHIRHFLSQIIFIDNLPAILIGTILQCAAIRRASVGLLSHDSSILIGCDYD